MTTTTQPTTATKPVALTTWQIGRHQTLDDRWDAHMTRLLRKEAELREERERARSSEDALSARREAAALMEAIRAHGRPKVKHYVSRPVAKHASGPARMNP